jgi:putative transposase
VRNNGRIVSVAVIVAVGVNTDGRRLVSAFIATAFAQDDAEAAKQQWRRVADQLRAKLPKLAALMDKAEPDFLAYIKFPGAASRQAALDQPDRTPQRRDQAAHQGHQHLPNEAAIVRLIGAILLEQNDEWAVQHARYMTLGTIEPQSDDPVVGLPAVAT